MVACVAPDHDHLGDVYHLLQFSCDWHADNEDRQPLVHQGRVLQDRFCCSKSAGRKDNVPRLRVHHV